MEEGGAPSHSSQEAKVRERRRRPSSNVSFEDTPPWLGPTLNTWAFEGHSSLNGSRQRKKCKHLVEEQIDSL